jgi:hypothetical protein
MEAPSWLRVPVGLQKRLLAGRHWSNRVGLPGVAKDSPCFEHLERPCTRASRPRKKSLAVAPAVPSEMIMGRATQPAFGGAIRCRVGLAQLLDGGRSN